MTVRLVPNRTAGVPRAKRNQGPMPVVTPVTRGIEPWATVPPKVWPSVSPDAAVSPAAATNSHKAVEETDERY